MDSVHVHVCTDAVYNITGVYMSHVHHTCTRKQIKAIEARQMETLKEDKRKEAELP